MPQKVRIALDAMGGDVGASVVIPGAAISLTRHPDTEFLLFGDRALIEAELAKHPAMKAASRVIHTDVAVSMHDKPSQALRRGRKTSSMWLAIDAVKKGEADVAISAGNTGALMAMGRFCLRMLPGIERPAIAAIWPTARGDSVILDVGATIGGDAQHLKTLALMGSAMASVLFDLERPTVGLLNIGVEEMKGREEIREAAELLRNLDLPQLNFIGFVEGGGIGKGAADVIVTEGFSGNISIKVAEGTARQMTEFLRTAMARTWRSKIGYLFARNAFKALKDKLDPNKSNGGVLAIRNEPRACSKQDRGVSRITKSFRPTAMTGCRRSCRMSRKTCSPLATAISAGNCSARPAPRSVQPQWKVRRLLIRLHKSPCAPRFANGVSGSALDGGGGRTAAGEICQALGGKWGT